MHPESLILKEILLMQDNRFEKQKRPEIFSPFDMRACVHMCVCGVLLKCHVCFAFSIYFKA